MEWNCDLCGVPTNEVWHYSLPLVFYEGERIMRDEDLRLCKDCREELAKFLVRNYKFNPFIKE